MLAGKTATLTELRDGDLEIVAADMREADRVEVWEGVMETPLQALQNSVRRSDKVAVMRIDETPVAIVGVGGLSILSDVGVPWLLGTEYGLTHARLLLKFTEPLIERMLRQYKVLRNIVHDDNVASKIWLKRAGFKLGPPEPVGWRGAKFRVFEMERS